MEWRTKPRIRRPGIIEPCIPSRATKPPAGPQWIHEIKHDGYRLIARKRDGRVRLFTRNGFDWSDRYPRISEAVAALRTASATIDGEAVWCDGKGLAIFDKLHSRAHDGEVSLYAFDLLELDGTDWRPRTLEERKGRLAKLLANAPPGIQYSEHLEGDGLAMLPSAETNRDSQSMSSSCSERSAANSGRQVDGVELPRGQDRHGAGRQLHVHDIT